MSKSKNHGYHMDCFWCHLYIVSKLWRHIYRKPWGSRFIAQAARTLLPMLSIGCTRTHIVLGGILAQLVILLWVDRSRCGQLRLQGTSLEEEEEAKSQECKMCFASHTSPGKMEEISWSGKKMRFAEVASKFSQMKHSLMAAVPQKHEHQTHEKL